MYQPSSCAQIINTFGRMEICPQEDTINRKFYNVDVI